MRTIFCFIPTIAGLIAAKWLLKLSKEEVLSINTCTDCYENSYADSDQQPWFTRLCTKPHLLLWVKQRGCPFWPAKLLAVDGSTVSVRFFGKSHGRADVPAINCQLYSQTNPSKACLKKHVDELSYAQKVCPIIVTQSNHYCKQI